MKELDKDLINSCPGIFSLPHRYTPIVIILKSFVHTIWSHLYVDMKKNKVNKQSTQNNLRDIKTKRGLLCPEYLHELCVTNITECAPHCTQQLAGSLWRGQMLTASSVLEFNIFLSATWNPGSFARNPKPPLSSLAFPVTFDSLCMCIVDRQVSFPPLPLSSFLPSVFSLLQHPSHSLRPWAFGSH